MPFGKISTHILDARFKELGHENVSMPLFIPESLLQKEKDHVEGFAPGGGLGDPRRRGEAAGAPVRAPHLRNAVLRPLRQVSSIPGATCPSCITSGARVVRWEKTTRPFLRSRGIPLAGGPHHARNRRGGDGGNRADAAASTPISARQQLAIPVIKGRKTDKEKFAGAEATYTIEAMMHDGKALQSGTSHYFGDGFARAFDITFQGRDNKPQYPHQTSWGMSTRIIGGIIMTHGDDNGLVLPPAIAPIQVVVVPVAQHKPGVLEKAAELRDRLQEVFRVKTGRQRAEPRLEVCPV